MPPQRRFGQVMETSFSRDQAAQIRAEAAVNGESYSAVIRRAVDAYFATKKKGKRRKVS